MTGKSAISIDATTCTGCGLCILSCPVDVIRLDAESGRARVAYGSDCQVCYLCEDDCPTHSISLSHDVTNSRRYSIYDDPRYAYEIRETQGSPSSNGDKA